MKYWAYSRADGLSGCCQQIQRLVCNEQGWLPKNPTFKLFLLRFLNDYPNCRCLRRASGSPRVIERSSKLAGLAGSTRLPFEIALIAPRCRFSRLYHPGRSLAEHWTQRPEAIPAGSGFCDTIFVSSQFYTRLRRTTKDENCCFSVACGISRLPGFSGS